MRSQIDARARQRVCQRSAEQQGQHVAIEGGVVDGQHGGGRLCAQSESVKGMGGAGGAVVVVAAAAADDGKSCGDEREGGEGGEEREADVELVAGNWRGR